MGWSTLVDITGRKFGRLTVAMRSSPIGSMPVRWHATCDCGNKCIVAGNKLKKGLTRSCGCLAQESRVTSNTTHGMSGTRTYRQWEAMRHRCLYPSQDNYKWYGGRGIKICERWNRFANFLADMGTAPDGLELDRKDTNGNYEPGNCRWITHKDNCNNRRSAKHG